MAKVTTSVPAMFADHHVLVVRQVLSALPGVKDVYASSAWQTVIVSYDPEKIKPLDIEKALTSAGYEPGKEPPVLAQSGDRFKDPAWNILGTRTTQTNEMELKISGEFRTH